MSKRLKLFYSEYFLRCEKHDIPFPRGAGCPRCVYEEKLKRAICQIEKERLESRTRR